VRGEVAIIGMACMFPGAENLDAYWQNIVSKIDAVSDPPRNSWDPTLYYDPHSSANDRVYCKRGGYLGDLARFNPLEHGVMPVTVDGGEPDQWLALQVAHEALADAGYVGRTGHGARTEVILGKGTYVNRGNMTVGYHGVVIEQVLHILKTLHPEHSEAELDAIKRELKDCLPPFSADTAPALIGNILAGRIANRLDLMGPAYTVDGACASALLATEIGVRNLLSHKCDLALVGGVHVNTPVPVFGLFCQLNALSRRQQIRPFDKDADGTILGEGLGMVVLKRLEDAERDEDRIYAVIKGVGSSSDGRAIHVMAPRLEGEVLALRRAYEMAGVTPDSVALVEAHGTATPVGDAVEIQALREVFGDRNGSPPRCALGSVKSMIGHTMPAAGIASLIKTALALHHKILPPTLHCEEPHPKLELSKTTFYPNVETRPWIHGRTDAPRRAGVNAFGFGGINAHVVLEEHTGSGQRASARSNLLLWDTEAFILEDASREGLMDRARGLLHYLERKPQANLKDLAYTLNTGLAEKPYRLAIVASSVEDLQAKLRRALPRLGSRECRQIKDVSGIYFFEEPVGRQGRLAFLFPGEGSQYANMLLDLSLHFPEVRACFDLADRAFVDHPRHYVPSDFIFPRPSFSDRESSAVEEKLWQIDGAVEAVLIADWAMLALLSRLSIRPDAILGHSTGDYAAMAASGLMDVTDEPGYIQTIVTLNRLYVQLSREVSLPESRLVAAATDHATSASIVEEVQGDVYVAMDNCPHQSVIVGTKRAAERAAEHLRSRGVIYEFLPFDRPYHTPLFEAYAEGWLGQFFDQVPIAAPKVPLYSCTSMAPYPSELAEIRELFVAHWVRPVRFRETVERMYADGIRTFIEVGPRGNLTAFVDDILRGSPHLAVPSNTLRRSGISQLNHLCAQLAAQGIPMRLDYLYARRAPRRLALDAPEVASDPKAAASMKLALGVPPFEVSSRKRAPGRPATTPSDLPALPPPAVADQRPVGVLAPPRAEPARAVGVGRSPGARSRVMQEYVATMDNFLGLQEQVMRAYLGGSRGGVSQNPMTVVAAPPLAQAPPSIDDASPAGTASHRSSELPSFPLLGKLTSFVPGQELVSVRRLDEREDIFLREHALGGLVSLTDETLRPLSIVPLTISMELLAEAAATLMPGRTLIGMREVRAYRWIQVEDEPVTLSITARRSSSAADQVEVEIRNVQAEATPVMQGVMIFGDAYPDPPPSALLSLDSEPVSRLASSNLYDGKLMFHGPCFQGVAAVERSGKDGLVGWLEVLPNDRLFRSDTSPRFVTDPVALDAAGQLVGYWTGEHLDRGFVVFPYRLEALHIYGPNRPAGERVKCRLRLRLMGASQIRSDLELVGADSRPWMRLVGWEDSRFDLPETFHRFWVAPRETTMSLSWRKPFDRFQSSESLECCRLESLFENRNALWTDLWASLVLSRVERKVFQALAEPSRQKGHWLLGRQAAKDAVRTFLEKHRHKELLPADIHIGEDEDGRPVPMGPWTRELASLPALSFAVGGGVAVAVAGELQSGPGLGVSVASIGEPAPESVEGAFGSDERELLDSLPPSDREEWEARCLCAKRSVANALGPKRFESLKSLRLLGVDARTGTIGVALAPELAGVFPQLEDVRMVAYTIREGNTIVGSTACEVLSS
jgi:acyl transferase domain-containing protein